MMFLRDSSTQKSCRGPTSDSKGLQAHKELKEPSSLAVGDTDTGGDTEELQSGVGETLKTSVREVLA